MEIQHPWQNGPTELIELALDRLHKDTDFDQRIAFLLLDIGVETTFKTFLQISPDATGTEMSYTKRKQASEGNFHELCRGIREAADSRLQGIDLSHVQFYHDLRNKLYHQGNGITIPSDKSKAYAALAVDLLNRLLEVDLTPNLEPPFDAEAEIVPEFVELQSEIKDRCDLIRERIPLWMARKHFAFTAPDFKSEYVLWAIVTRGALEEYRTSTQLPEPDLSWPITVAQRQNNDWVQDAWEHELLAESRKLLPGALHEYLAGNGLPDSDALNLIGSSADVEYFQISVLMEEELDMIRPEDWQVIPWAEEYCDVEPTFEAFKQWLCLGEWDDVHYQAAHTGTVILEALNWIYGQL